ncbi:hypothetical protein JW835_05400 [bacterium]|nr:hypothetical protein [bacterium]
MVRFHWFLVLFVEFSFSLLLYPKNNHLQFEHLTTERGLSQSTITCILQDHNGFMWFGTQDGLNRYDGYQFTVYRHHPSDSNSISSNSIYALFEDSQKNLWVGTESGLDLFHSTANTFRHYRHDADNDSSLSHNQVMSISEDKKGDLWIGTNGGGLNRYDREKDRFVRFKQIPDDPNSLSSNDLYTVYCDSRDYVWIGSWHGHVDLYRVNNQQFVRFKRFGDFIIRSVLEDQDGDIWICTHGDGLIRVRIDSLGNFKQSRYRHNTWNANSLCGNAVFTIREDQQNRLWIGTENEGLNVFNKETGAFQHYTSDVFDKKSLSHNSIWSIYEDRTGNFWIGTFAGGINLLPQFGGGFRHYQHNPGNDQSLSHNSVTSFFEDSQGDLWIGTDGGGLNIFDEEDGTFNHYDTRNSQLSSNSVLSIFEDSRGRCWIGTWAGGLNLFDRKTGRSRQYTRENSGLSSNNVFSIIEDRKGRLWIGAFWGGVSCLEFDNNRFINFTIQNSQLTDDHIRVVIEDAFGKLWIGGDLGLNCLDPETRSIVTFRHDEEDTTSISKGWVLTILEASDSTLWVGTTGGLNRFHRDTETFTRFYIKDGLPNDAIKGLREDDHGNLWLSTNKGISRYDPKTGEFKNYDISDGLQGNEFYQCSHFKSSHGDIYFGGVNGFNVFHPSELTHNTYVPPIVFTDFQIFNRPVPIGDNSPLNAHISEVKHIRLSYKQNVISFEFAALNYIFPEKNQYAYRLAGSDFDDWNYVGTKRSATYTNLDPGEYSFIVMASNNDGVWNETGVSVDIIIEPPFWETWWFRLCVALLIGLILFMLYKWRVRSHHTHRRKLEMEVRERTIEVEQQKKQVEASYEKLSETGKTVVFHSSLVSQVFMQVDRAMNDMKDGSMSQTNFIDKTKSIVESFLSTIRNVTYETKKSSVAAEKTVQAVASGTQSIQATLDYMENIEKNVYASWDIMKSMMQYSAHIDEIILFIDDVASRVNVLALNALIEATKAGDFGKGFMVVAQEIRDLARTTSKSTVDISKSISELQSDLSKIEKVIKQGLDDVKESARIAGEGRVTLDQIYTAVEEEMERLHSIADKVNQMQEFSYQVQHAMDNVASVNQKNQEIVRTIKASSSEVGFLIEDLSKLALALKRK